ncbi:MAG: arginine repressor [Paludibacteraceae bacterium]|nr:arginine repressor [Bacteroidales bacterium]MBO5132554.1 arginine repressor [Paludibacteraceae bacterium]MBQ9100247.1 arginine repressor [Paludibacteraceae bacterium]MBR6658585.1 arginine repressor [Paludibacteraceae bacterium]
MKNKVKRIAAIKEIISTTEVGSQEELLQSLAKAGFELTQGTLSRDMKQLKVVKTTNSSGMYVYKLPAQQELSEEVVKTRTTHDSVLVSLDFSSNIVVIHTRPGYASSMAYEIDVQANDVILGTVAGDDTIIAVKREELSQQDVIDALSRFIPSLKK